MSVASLLVMAGILPAAGVRAGDCAPKVDAAAERVYSKFVQAMRKADADGIVDLMAEGKDARLTLHLSGVKHGPYTKEQALEVLKTVYFKSREILSVTEDEGCTRGTELRLTRMYRMRARVGGKEQDGTLMAVIELGPKQWSLDILGDS